MLLNLIKAHGSQNTFFVLDIRNQTYFTDSVLQKLAITLCNPKGILQGADGVLYVDKGSNTLYKMRIFNADGTEALMCGNGMRIVARWALEQSNQNELAIENVTEFIYNVAPATDYHDQVKGVAIQFPEASLDSAEIIVTNKNTFINTNIPELDNKLLFTAVAMPNPHIVSIVSSVDLSILATIGKQANELKSVFPFGVNVSFVQQVDAQTLFVATYERGVGLTNACGTAMIASCVACLQLGKIKANEWIVVKNPGGFVNIKVDENYAAKMIGNATYLFEAIVEIDEEELDVYTIQEITPNRKEIEGYEMLLHELKQTT